MSAQIENQSLRGSQEPQEAQTPESLVLEHDRLLLTWARTGELADESALRDFLRNLTDSKRDTLALGLGRRQLARWERI
jgi:hypothetical protein